MSDPAVPPASEPRQQGGASAGGILGQFRFGGRFAPAAPVAAVVDGDRASGEDAEAGQQSGDGRRGGGGGGGGDGGGDAEERGAGASRSAVGSVDHAAAGGVLVAAGGRGCRPLPAPVPVRPQPVAAVPVLVAAEPGAGAGGGVVGGGVQVGVAAGGYDAAVSVVCMVPMGLGDVMIVQDGGEEQVREQNYIAAMAHGMMVGLHQQAQGAGEEPSLEGVLRSLQQQMEARAGGQQQRRGGGSDDQQAATARGASVSFESLLLRQERQGSGAVLLESYSFENIAAYVMGPQDDWEQCIARHAKLWLDPRTVYRVTAPVHINSVCYVVGNGARVIVECEHNAVFNVAGRRRPVSIYSMWAVTFQNVVFECAARRRVILCKCSTDVNFHGCNFINFPGVCLDVREGGRIRGCYFLGCRVGIRSFSAPRVTVRSCTFEKCLVGVMAKFKIKLVHNAAVDTYCFCLLRGAAVVKNNTVMSPTRITDQNNISVVTCASGQVVPLTAVHVVGNPRTRWPLFVQNTFSCCRVYLGNRRGSVSFTGCAMHFCALIMEREVMPKVSLAGVFDQSLSAVRVVSRETGGTVARQCECGHVHVLQIPLVCGVTEELRVNHRVISCDTIDHSSSGED
ncbi:E1B large [Guinea pig adenovirus 1]|uniref:E1B large n=1 Tax=Guinea pig adenovirus 1 TaxID=2847100 RepID=A0AC61LZW8_9ADEN|nr:E1B large [Guinea pig adenovirus]QIZ64146.1 E1B large [Guinea pig adenovirus 1]